MLDAFIVVFVRALDKRISNHRPKDQRTHAKNLQYIPGKCYKTLSHHIDILCCIIGCHFFALATMSFFCIFEVTIVLASIIFLGSRTYGYGLFDRPISSDSQLSLIIGYLFVCHDHIWSKVRCVTKSSDEGQSLDHIWSKVRMTKSSHEGQSLDHIWSKVRCVTKSSD